MVTDYLFAEKLLIERIKEKMGSDLKTIQGVADLADVEERGDHAPLADVVYLGDIDASPAAGQQGGTGGIQVVTQLWAVVLGVSYSDPNGTGTGVRELGGTLAAKLLRSLLGWKPAEFTAAVKRGAPVQARYKGDMGYFPFTFRVQFVFNAKESS